MIIYQIIKVTTFENGLEDVVISQERFDNFQAARNYVISDIARAEIKKLSTDLTSDPVAETLRARVVFKNAQTIYKLEKIIVDCLMEFCYEEAKFRLTEFHGIKPEEISDNMFGDVADLIWDEFDSHERFWDDVDDDIRDYLLEQKEEDE